MKKIIITLIALFSVLVFSQPIRADTEQIATINLDGSWGNAKAVITRTNGKYHLNLTSELANERGGTVPISTGATTSFIIQKNSEPSKEVLSLTFDSLGKRSGDVDLDIDDKDNYTGWLTVNGAVVYSVYPAMDVVPISYVSTTQNINVKASPITINYVDENGRTIHDSQQITGNYGDNYDATSSSYKLDLKGYTLDQSKLPNNATGKISSIEQTVTYVYQPNKYQVKFDANDGTTTPSWKYQKFTYDQPQNLASNTFVKPGYLFSAWNTSKDGSGISYSNNQFVKNLESQSYSIYNLYAQWNASDQDITFDANGGSTDQKKITAKTDTIVDLSNVKNASRPGYVFKGWYTNKEGGTKIPTTISMPAGGSTYYAQWEGVLSFKEVPEILSFNESKISNRTSEALRTDPNWKMTVEDTRIDKNPWRVTAKLVEPFKNSSDESAIGNILLFRKANASDQWITNSEETNVFDGTSTKGIDDYDVSWSQDSGPIIQAAPGTVKAGEYKGVIQWSLTDAPV